MRWSILLGGLLAAQVGWAQAPDQPAPLLSVRVSVLLVPFTPLLTVETRTVGRFTLQGETNFRHTHGLNARYYLREPLQRGFFFFGSAWVRNALLREDNSTTVLPYAGYGYAWGLGTHWTVDARAGVGPAINADVRRIYPVVKIGAGRKF